MNLANSSEIQLGEETNWNCCVCWWRGGERGRRWVDRRGKEDRPPLLHPTPPNASPALVESPALPAGEAAAAGTKSILGLRDSAAACEPAPALWAPTWGWHLAPGTWHLASPLGQRGAGTEPKNRSRAHHSTDSRRMQNWCELLFSGSYSWKI